MLKKRRNERTITIGLSLLLFALLCACSQQAKKQQNLGSLLPKSIDEWQQVQLITGTEALEQINSLHGKDIIVEAGAIGTYQLTGKRPAMVWISRSKTADLTREQAEVMADKMVSNPRSPFHDPETFISNKIKVYKFLGMGQVHYIFCREQLGYWISAPPGDGEKLLLYFLKNGGKQSLVFRNYLMRPKNFRSCRSWPVSTGTWSNCWCIQVNLNPV